MAEPKPALLFSVVPEGYKFEANGKVRVYAPAEAFDPDIGFEQIIASEFGLEASDVFKAIMKGGGLRSQFGDEWAQGAQEYASVQKARRSIVSILRTPSGELDSREKYSRISFVVYQNLYANGAFYHDLFRKESHWFDSESKVLLGIQSEEFRAYLSTRFQLNREDSAFKWSLSSVQDRTLRYARRVEPRRLSYYDPEEHVLYFNHRPGRVLVLNGESIREIDNGNPILFTWNEDWTPVEPDFSGTGMLSTLILRRLMLDPEESFSTLEEAEALNERWILAILFRNILPERPLLGLIGEPGSGKTLFAELIGLLFFGRNFTPLGFEDQKEDGAIAYLTNSTYGVFDNADQPVRWLPDLLARAATGMSVPRRKLYTTNDLAKYPADCFLAITARQTPWARTDIIDRLLLYKVKRPKKFISRNLLRESVIENRPRLIGELLLKANDAVGRLKQDASREEESPFRLSAFYSFALRTLQGRERTLVETAFTKIVRHQGQLQAEQEESLLTLLRNWLENVPKEDQDLGAQDAKWTRPMRVSEIYGRLANYAKFHEFRFTIRNPLSLGHRLGELRPTLQISGILFKKGKDEKGITWGFGLPLQQGKILRKPSECSDSSADAQPLRWEHPAPA